MLPVARLRASFSRIFAFAASMRACCSGLYFGMNHRLFFASLDDPEHVFS